MAEAYADAGSAHQLLENEVRPARLVHEARVADVLAAADRVGQAEILSLVEQMKEAELEAAKLQMLVCTFADQRAGSAPSC